MALITGTSCKHYYSIIFTGIANIICVLCCMQLAIPINYNTKISSSDKTIHLLSGISRETTPIPSSNSQLQNNRPLTFNAFKGELSRRLLSLGQHCAKIIFSAFTHTENTRSKSIGSWASTDAAYRKIPIISPAFIFVGRLFCWACFRREISVSNWA